MTTKFQGVAIWPPIRKALGSSKRPAHMAVAYLRKEASRLLPLPHGSRLVVDASGSTVRSGQTCPNEPVKLQKHGVRIFSASNLHADDSESVCQAEAGGHSEEAVVDYADDTPEEVVA